MHARLSGVAPARFGGPASRFFSRTCAPCCASARFRLRYSYFETDVCGFLRWKQRDEAFAHEVTAAEDLVPTLRRAIDEFCVWLVACTIGYSHNDVLRRDQTAEIEGDAAMTLRSTNPATGEPGRGYEEMPTQRIPVVLEATAAAARDWAARPITERTALVRAAAGVLRARADEFAVLMAEEMGKPVTAGRSEIEKCAWACEFYADRGASFLENDVIVSDARRSYVRFAALGVVFAVMPWNFPFWQVFRFAAPALVAGNGGLLKHASNVPGCALAIESVLREAGLPEDLFRTLLISSDHVERVIESAHVNAVTLTGSTPAGRAVASASGNALKKTVLELGGSDPYVVLEDADVAAAAEACVTGRMVNAGQSCIAAKRWIVVRAVGEEFSRAVVERMRAQRMGDPLSASTEVGPMAREDLRDELHEQVKKSVAAGARVLLGGEVPDRAGAWYPPTVLTDVGPGMPAYDEETFGPVAAIIPVADEDEAVRVANDSLFGLGAAVFTRDLERGERIAAERLEAGSCFVNTFVRSDPRLPFGGIRESGYGRELGSYGIREFVNAKTVYLA